MKRRSFLALGLGSIGLKIASKAQPKEADIRMGDHLDQSGNLVRMDEAGDTARQWLADQLWYETRSTKFDL